MVEARKSMISSQWWWFETQKNSYKNPSPWLQSTLDELDKRIFAMLRIIEEDADSFARRAEMFYKKRPELISMIQDFYRAHRLLAEGYDQVKSESGARIISPWQLPSTNLKYHAVKSVSSTDIPYDFCSETFEVEESELSEVEDPEPEEAQIQKENGTEKLSVCNAELLKLREEIQRVKEIYALKDMKRAEVSSDIDNDVVAKLQKEIERLKEVSRIQKELLAQKDEEKREAIRQLSLAMDFLRKENTSLKKAISLNAVGAYQHPPKIKVPKQGFWRRFFPQSPPKAEVSLVTF